jgi:hypothetical protein
MFIFFILSASPPTPLLSREGSGMHLASFGKVVALLFYCIYLLPSPPRRGAGGEAVI